MVSTVDAVVTPSPTMIPQETKAEEGSTMSARTLILANTQQPAMEKEEVVSNGYMSDFQHSDWIQKKEKSNSSEMNVSFNKDELQLLDLLEPAF
jgi:hypothetical protein